MRRSRAVSIFFLLKMEYTFVRSQQSFWANQATERSCRCSSDSMSCPICIIAVENKKKAEPFVTYFILRYRQAPCNLISTNGSRP